MATASGAYLTSYGEAEATLLIAEHIGAANSATRETFLDTTDDDNDDDPNVMMMLLICKVAMQEFFLAWIDEPKLIEAIGLGMADSVDNGDGYSIIRPATALKLNDDHGDHSWRHFQ